MDTFYELSLKVSEPVEQNVEIIAAYLSEFGFEGSAEDDELKAYRSSKQVSRKEIKILAEELLEKKLVYPNYTIKLIKPQNWNAEWEKNYFQPVLIANKLLIKSSFHKTDKSAEYEIVIDPKMSFGTGHHETTSMLASFLLEAELKDLEVLDMGTGTGILGILACMRGCKYCLGIDNDRWCYENATENTEINHIQNMEIRLGDAGLLQSYPKRFDLVLANINRHILLKDMHYYIPAMKNHSRMILSGFYSEDVKDIVEKAESLGLEKIQAKEQNKWASLMFDLNK